MGFSKIETVITSQIANLFQKRGSLEPTALIKALEREVIKQEKKTAEGIIVPNDYTLFLCEEDCHRLSAARIIKALYEAVERKVIRENCYMDGNLSVRIEKMNEGNDAIVIKSVYVDEKHVNEDTINLENDVISNTLIEDKTLTKGNEQTIVADKNNLTNSMRIKLPSQIEYAIANLILENDQYILGERHFYIGRNQTSDLVISDDSVSRVHSYITYERHRHVLNDSNSLNGTYVNGKLILKQILNHGDNIRIGNVSMLYQAI